METKERKKKNGRGYRVVFRGTKAAGGYEGIMTWTQFASKKDFDKWYTLEMKRKETIVEEGVTEERAVELTMQTPFACRVAAAIQEAFDGDGYFDSDIFQMKITSAVFAEQEARKIQGLPSLDTGRINKVLLFCRL